MKETYQINDLEQVRLLGDPLKLRILQAFAEDPKSTKQVAAELGERVTRLYRHVDALQDAGLLEVVDEKQKRGTIERTFRAIARRFEADPALFTGRSDDGGASAVRELLRISEAEIVDVLAKADGDEGQQAMILRIQGRASAEKIAELRRSLDDWVDSLPDDEPHGKDDRQFAGLVAFYIVD